MTVEDLLNNLIPCRTCINHGDILSQQTLTKLLQIINSPNLAPKCSEELKVIYKDVENISGIFENLKRLMNRDESIIVLDDEDTSDVEMIGSVINIEEVNRVEYRNSWVQNNNDVQKYRNVDSIQPIDSADTLNDNCQSKCDIEGTSKIEQIENYELIAEISRLEENQHLHGLNSERERTRLCPLECRIQLERCDPIYKTLIRHGKRSQYSDEDTEFLRLIDLSSVEKKSNKRSYTSSDGPTTRSPKKRTRREKVCSDASDIDSYYSSDSSDNSTDNKSNCDNHNFDEFDDFYDDNSDDSDKRAKLRLLQDSDASDSSDEEVDDSEDELKSSKNNKKYKSSQKLERKKNSGNFKLPGDEFLKKKKFKDPNDLEPSSCNDDAESGDSSSSDASEEKDNHSEPLSNHENAVIVPILKIKTPGRKDIRKVLDDQDITENTKKAVEDEENRRKRVEKRKEQLECSLRSKESDADEDNLILDFDADSKPVVTVDKGLVKLLKSHQREGVKFMWDCSFESVQQIQQQEGSGCVLAHCMGLGKTLQVVTLSHTLLTNQLPGIRTVMIACPNNTILNWVDEFRMWLEDSQVVGDLSKRIFEFSQDKNKSDRIKLLNEWQQNGGVLIIGYEMFRTSTSPKKENLEMRKLLLNPGADLVVCDEGHLLKNDKSNLAKRMQSVRTQRRIILTGTPLQNNLKEYHCMIHFVKPNLLGSKKEFANRFVNPINNGKLHDSTDDDVKLMKYRAYVLHRLLEGCLQRRDYELLKSLLPSKQEYVISVRLSDLQMGMYDHYVSKVAKASGKKIKFFKDYLEIKRLVAHPKSLQPRTKEKHRGKPSADQANGSEADSWWRNFVEKENLDDISLSYKLVFLFGLLDSCAKQQDKVLVFSQCLHTLDVIEMFLKSAEVSDDNSITPLKWKAGHDYYRIDGDVSIEKRSEMCKSFNNPANKNVKLMLMSTKAGGLGINLTGANRVVVFAPSWNPSDDLQSIFRVFRFGQGKQCYVYRLVCAGTMEEKMYNRQVTKLSLSLRVLDEQQVERHYKGTDLTELYKLKKLEDKSLPTEGLKDELLANLLTTHRKYVFNVFEHESLLKNQEDEQLDEQERQQAWHDYQHEKHNSKTKAKPVAEEQPSC